MNNRIYITDAILDAIKALKNAGHGVELEPTGGGNSHTSALIIIGVRHAEEASYVRKLKIKYTHSYQRFDSWSAISPEFGELCYGECSLNEILAGITQEKINAWRAEMNKNITDAARKMAQV